MAIQEPDLRPARLEDELVFLIPLEAGDYERIYQVASDPKIWEQHPSRNRYRREVFQAYFDSAVESQSAFLVFDRLSGQLIGCTRYYDYKPEESSVAIGFTFLACAWWGGRYNRAMKKLLIDHAFHFADKIIFHIGPTNYRSQQALLKIGGVKTGEVDFDHYGAKELHFEYEISRANWQARQ